MLVSLHVKNMALIEEQEVAFGPGLNIMTGETGAGKSILIGSLNVALGAGSFKDYVPEGADYALVELVFVTENRETLERLEKAGCTVYSTQDFGAVSVWTDGSRVKITGFHSPPADGRKKGF